MIEPTDEMVQAFNGADFTGCGSGDREDEHVRRGLAAVLAIVEREHEAELAKLRGAVTVMETSRNWWRDLARGEIVKPLSGEVTWSGDEIKEISVRFEAPEDFAVQEAVLGKADRPSEAARLLRKGAADIEQVVQDHQAGRL